MANIGIYCTKEYGSSLGGESMIVRYLEDKRFRVGDLVTVRSLGSNRHFCIIGFKRKKNGESLAVLKGLFQETHVIEKPISELQNLLIRGIL
ncbi:hypothetical protein Slip_2350 [Syntrophothermus lipocalidus DSM 12680]|uniref:Uncharacterized protein n=2 Tax=Syntrophothermus TaxID=129001 RepID=D7CKA3_SYNLT|nr:hypothetical protein Slip_2350 [Syntrophothermus lipocalidus DSM 12680]